MVKNLPDTDNFKNAYCPSCERLTKFAYKDESRAECWACNSSFRQSYLEKVYEAYKNGTHEEFLRNNPKEWL